MVHRRILTGGICAIVATFAVGSYAGMIKHPGGKTIGVMAHTAILGRGNVIYRLTNGCRAIVAGGTITGDIHVVENRRTKCRGRMAKVAILTGG